MKQCCDVMDFQVNVSALWKKMEVGSGNAQTDRLYNWVVWCSMND